MKALFEHTKFTKYYITDKGEVYSRNTRYHKKSFSKRKIHHNKKRGYLYIRTSITNYLVHRLVASAFLKNPLNKPCVNHKDGNKKNNNVTNLEWVTFKENSHHAKINGLWNPFKKNEGPKLKYTNEQCREVKNLVLSGLNYTNAGKIHSMPYSTVAHLMRGSRRKI